MKKAKKAYGYIRTATVMQAGKTSSIEIQKKLISDYCQKNNIKLIETFIDAGASGLNINRPSLKKLLNQAKKGNVNTVVIKDFSRLSRKLTDYLLIKEELKKSGVEIVNISSPDSAEEDLATSIYLIVSEFDKDIKKERR